jgi:CRP/FNR family cyclic AMP-dependent transcriptional regulator
MAAHADAFAGSTALADDEVRALSERGVVRSYPRNTIVVSEGDQTDSLYIIVSGRIKVFVADADGRELVLRNHGPGEYFGEMTLDGGPRSASVLTLEDCRFVVVPRSELQSFLAQHPAFAMHLVSNLIRRVRALTDSARSLALMDVYGRVARLLLEVAVPRDGALVADKLTQQEIAGRVGASREMISRILKDLVAGGYLRMERKTITICKHLPPRW